jgi:hypothetical protein
MRQAGRPRVDAGGSLLAELDGGDQSICNQTRRAITSAERSDPVPLILAAG